MRMRRAQISERGFPKVLLPLLEDFRPFWGLRSRRSGSANILCYHTRETMTDGDCGLDWVVQARDIIVLQGGGAGRHG